MPGEMRAFSFDIIHFHSPTRPGNALDLEDFKSAADLNFLELDQRLIASATSNWIGRESLPMAREVFGDRVLRCVELPSSLAWKDTDFANYRKIISDENTASILKFREAIEKAASYPCHSTQLNQHTVYRLKTISCKNKPKQAPLLVGLIQINHLQDLAAKFAYAK